MKKSIFITGIALVLAFSVQAETFRYIHRAGEKYRIISTVNENVYVNYLLSHKAEIVNRIAVEVTAVSGEKGTHKAVFQTAEKASGVGAGKSFQWAREYESEFVRDAEGYLTIDPKYYMPVVRNVPVFPDRDLKIGETWTADGYEMHDFRDSFGIEEPYRIPFTATYKYLGLRKWKDAEYPAFSVSYRITYEPAAVGGRTWPKRIMGASDQTVFWDSTAGYEVAYKEEFRMVFELSDGRTIEYKGNAEAEVIESAVMDKQKIAEEITEQIKDIPDAAVKVVDDGVTITLEDIQFEADSAVLRNSEKAKLDKIAAILALYPDRDILVGGHTALAGTAEGRALLSEQRAAAVADYLLSKGVRTPERVIVQGYGADFPVADNVSEEGRRRNRRVEITILEN